MTSEPIFRDGQVGPSEFTNAQVRGAPLLKNRITMQKAVKKILQCELLSVELLGRLCCVSRSFSEGLDLKDEEGLLKVSSVVTSRLETVACLAHISRFSLVELRVDLLHESEDSFRHKAVETAMLHIADYLVNCGPRLRVLDAHYNRSLSHRVWDRLEVGLHNRQLQTLRLGNRPIWPRDPNTTVMLRNVPTRVTSEELVSIFNAGGCGESFDFLHLPRERGSKRNRGFAVMNFLHPAGAEDFFNIYGGLQFRKYRSPKAVDIIPAAIQGFEAAVDRFGGQGIIPIPFAPSQLAK